LDLATLKLAWMMEVNQHKPGYLVKPYVAMSMSNGALVPFCLRQSVYFFFACVFSWFNEK